MQTANDADGGNIFPDITAEEAGYSATARIEMKDAIASVIEIL